MIKSKFFLLRLLDFLVYLPPLAVILYYLLSNYEAFWKNKCPLMGVVIGCSNPYRLCPFLFQQTHGAELQLGYSSSLIVLAYVLFFM